MNASRPKARCSDCQSTVFADRQVEKIINSSDGSEATLLTNRYLLAENHIKSVSRIRRDLRNIGQNHGREYKDPCRLID